MGIPVKYMEECKALMSDSKDSFNTVQYVIIHLLSQLIKNQLFVTAHASLTAIYDL